MAGTATRDPAPAPGPKKVLEGVERIHWDTTHVLCFPGSVSAAMRFMGEEVSNVYVMGISGGAFKLFWLLPWAPSNCDLLCYGEEPVRRTFAALGYDYTWLPDYHSDHPHYPEAFYREHIVRDIDAGKPVLAIGIVGPPECCVITGYEDGGRVLYGTSYFQEEKTGYFRVENWYKDVSGLILIGDQAEKPPRRKVLADTLEWAIRLARETEIRSTVAETQEYGWRTMNGLAAYDTIAEMLARDEEFRDLDAGALEMRCIALGNDGLCLLWCKREAAADFLAEMMDAAGPAADDLRAAIDAYRAEVEILKEASGLTPFSFSPEAEQRKLLDRARREEIAALVCRAKYHEEQAIEALERALPKLNA